MGKGSNVQKKEAARDRNLKDKSKTPEERAAATKKAKADAEVRRARTAAMRDPALTSACASSPLTLPRRQTLVWSASRHSPLPRPAATRQRH